MSRASVGAKVLKCLAIIWFVLAGLFIAGCLVVVWWKHGFAKVQEIMSPFNVLNLLIVGVLMSPGMGAFWLAEWLEQKQPRGSAK